MRRIFVSAGETSGDIHASHLVRELLARDASLEVFGMGGTAMAAAGCEVLHDYGTLDLMGFTGAITNLLRFRAVFRKLVAVCRERLPDVAVLVDYPGFHMRLASYLKELGVPVVTYIAPQVWAWRKGRARQLARLARKVLVIFDFEEPIFREAGADVEFVGHPLLDEMDLGPPGGRPAGWGEAREKLGVAGDAPLVAVLPGTRGQILRRLLPVFMGAADIIREAIPDARFAIGTRDGSPLPGDAARAHDTAPPVESRALLRDATAGLLVSGTSTLEAALYGCPGIVGYKMGLVNYLIAECVRRVPDISLANIVLGERVYPEILQYRLTPRRAAGDIVALVTDPERREEMSAKLKGVRERLGGAGASGRAAEAVLGVIA